HSPRRGATRRGHRRIALVLAGEDFLVAAHSQTSLAVSPRASSVRQLAGAFIRSPRRCGRVGVLRGGKRISHPRNHASCVAKRPKASGRRLLGRLTGPAKSAVCGLLSGQAGNRLARDGVFIHQTSSGGRPKESSCVNIRGSSFVEVCQGSADRRGGARPVPYRREAGVDDLRLHGRDAAPRRASSHTRGGRARRWRRAWWWRTRRRRTRGGQGGGYREGGMLGGAWWGGACWAGAYPRDG